MRNGYLLIYVPSKDVEFEKGEEAMTVGLGFPFSCRLLSPPSVSFPPNFFFRLFPPFSPVSFHGPGGWLGDGGEEIGDMSAGRAGMGWETDMLGVERSGQADCRVRLFY